MPLTAFVLLAGFATITDQPCVMNGFVQLLKRGEGIVGRLEAAAFVVRGDDGTFRLLLWPRNNFAKSETYRGEVPAGTVAIAHTHPPNMEQPSRGDVAESMRLGLRLPAEDRGANAI